MLLYRCRRQQERSRIIPGAGERLFGHVAGWIPVRER